MEKVSDKWFKDHGWTRHEYWTKPGDYDDIAGQEETVRHSVQYRLDTKNINGYWESVIYVTPPTRWKKKKSIERFYMFYLHNKKNNFTVENKITHKKLTTDQIEAALKVVGYKEGEV